MVIMSAHVGNSLLPDQCIDRGRPLDRRRLVRPRLGESIHTATSAGVSVTLES